MNVLSIKKSIKESQGGMEYMGVNVMDFIFIEIREICFGFKIKYLCNLMNRHARL